ncbi:MAG: hypothetical protein ACE145_09740 [Terriglobia bacterium]
MARVSIVGPRGEVSVCNPIEFERNPVWTKILGPLPSRAGESGSEGGEEPESEYILQRLIELYPEVLPWHEFSDGPPADKVGVCVVCEGAASAATDVLLVERTGTGTGRFVIVETKLIKNPEIFRAVVGQILEYAAKLSSGETLETLEERAINYWKTRLGRFNGEFHAQMKKAFGEGWQEAIWESAFENLRRGNVRLLIVSDSVPEDLRLAVTFLPANVLLAAVEVQAHEGAGKEGELVCTGAVSTAGIGPEALHATALRYLSQVRLSLATIRLTNSGHFVSEAHDRGKAPIPRIGRPYSDYLEKLGGTESVPGKMLEMLREKTLKTGGFIDEGQKNLTFRLWGLPGLNVSERDDQLYIEFWASSALGSSRPDRMDEARNIFRSQFPTDKDGEHFYKTSEYGFRFHPIGRSSTLDQARQLLQRLEIVYESLHKPH